MIERTDEQLFQDYLDGNQQALVDVIERYRPLLLGSITRKLFGDRQAAEDVLQNTVIQIIRNKMSFDPTLSFRSWLFTAAYRLTKDVQKTASRRSKHVVTESSLCGEDGVKAPVQVETRTPYDIASEREETAQALSILGSLPANIQASVRNVVLGGQSSREAAPALGVSYRQVQNQVNTGIEKIRQQMFPTATPAS